MSIESLSAAQCTLLAVHYAAEGNVAALHSFTPSRLDVLDPTLVLRIVLTYLPETLDPKLYTTYISEVASRLYLDFSREDVVVDTAPVKDLDDAQARKKVKKLELLDIQPPAFPPHAPDDLLTRFICHRAYRIDRETGALNMVPQLVEPFLERNSFIRIWYISVVLPLLRLNYEYYPMADTPVGMTDFEKMEGKEGIEFLLGNASKNFNASSTATDAHKSMVSRDMKGLVGPWMYGHTERKRRRIETAEDQDGIESITNRTGKISLSGVSFQDKTGHDWEYVYKWMTNQAQDQFPLVSQLVEDWDGPADLDLGGLDKGLIFYLDDDTEKKLEAQYAQAAFAACYAAQADTEATIRGAHGILARLAELLDFIPPPDLATSVDSLPKIERHAIQLEESKGPSTLEPDELLKPEHPLTTPRMEAYMLLQMIVYSAYQFSGLGHNISVVGVAKVHIYDSAEEQLHLLQGILKSLAKSGRRDEAQWTSERSRLIWLWNWGIDPANSSGVGGAGPLGKIKKSDFEQELLKVFIDASLQEVDPAINIESTPESSEEQTFPFTVSEQDKARLDGQENNTLEAYDGASNGNKTRGGVKKANEIISAFRSHFPQSKKFAAIAALISATHALSFYSLTLQHGVPFQPVNIRVSKDPIELISKVLEQNARSYAKLDDLVSIAENLASAGLEHGVLAGDDANDETKIDTIDIRKDAGRRVTFMAVEAALREDDFETAYSYIVSRLTPSTAQLNAPPQKGHNRNISTSSTLSKAQPIDDDTSWRAAYLAGRYRPSAASPPTLRRLEQRTELLSLALLLAPANALTDILSAWRRCEEETSALQLSQQQEEQAFDDHADRREPSALPGNFMLSGDQPEMILNQKRREMGRMATNRGDSEAPLSMYDLTRSAARAFSRNVNLGTVRQSLEAPSEQDTDGLRPGSSGQNPQDADTRVRRRDMVANAVSGGLASGIGWVLGAKPAEQH
ncbi:hypothetical protein AMS68_001833 [Peltaster fructicola]|uniref:Sec39 domain-containing protein n=1 Tax=Peltaster fructicola TaxID=286661 RepID=A0A6H0XNQ3_9PEZI|nr:hypothetical protein AMS68_001833 [Peltaster fructicola]